MDFDDGIQIDASASGSTSRMRPEPTYDEDRSTEEQQQHQQEGNEEDDNEAMFTEEQADGSFAASTDKSQATVTPRVSKLSEGELDALYARLDRLRQELAEARAGERRNVDATAKLNDMERERDRYRATVLSLAYQNKLLNDELNKRRKGTSEQVEKYTDAKLQIQDLKEVLALKEKEVEELKAARDFMPTSDRDLLEGYKRMRDVFESLRSTLSCSLCYELYKPNDVTTLECGHTMCRGCLQQWSDTHVRLYNLATTPDCPECRQPGRHYVKVFLLEEVVRTVDRLERLEAENEAVKQAARKARLEAQRAARRTGPRPVAANGIIDLSEDTDEEAEQVSAELLGKEA